MPNKNVGGLQGAGTDTYDTSDMPDTLIESHSQIELTA